ncbi:MAG TPA: 4-hydroxythreonine-4-phosphate dehydrogenase PdxA, partial [Planctomycetota bacterium]|nr:4-hydroxythreonine-4-phosphate dehydrogenase PdxA [Planctomycetota bacterium]
MKIPLILITLGDPAGIGPEIILKTLPKFANSQNNIIIIGSLSVLRKTAQFCGISCSFQTIQNLPNILLPKNKIYIWDIDNIDIQTYKAGKINANYGKAAWEYIQMATKLALEYHPTAIVTAPIHKVALQMANIKELGHTEILQTLTNVNNTLTMFVVDKLRVFFYTRHQSLQQAIFSLNIDSLVSICEQIDRELKKIGFQQPKLAMAALNPHASDDGLFGTEETSILQPAIAKLQQKNIHIQGPIPADSVFYQGLQGKYDAILSLYHDQGHIACKTYNFEKTVSVTLGLPFIRT